LTAEAAAPGLAPRNRQAVLAALGAELAPSLGAAAIAAFFIAAVGGRLAMFVLRVTSGPEAIGLESDDGFVIGRFTSATFGFVFFLTLLPAFLLGATYALARLWFPPRWRTVVFAAFFAIFGGALLVHADGVDFTVLSPRWLAVGMFIAIPAAFGAALEPLHALVRGRLRQLPERALLAITLVTSVALLITPPTIAMVLVGWVVVLLGYGDRAAALLRSSQCAWAGRLAMLALVIFASVDLGRDLNALF
jgi:hypothetical protein